MKPFKLAHMPKSETDTLVKALRENPDYLRKWAGLPSNATAEDVEFTLRQVVARSEAKEYWNNDKYQVAIFEADTEEGFPPMWHLSIKRHDRAPVFNWRDIQTLKNELIGPENEAVQLFPAESRLVDGANQYHLFVLKDPKIRFPFGFPNRMVTDETLGKSRNRPTTEGR
jgi:hypothetical protein